MKDFLVTWEMSESTPERYTERVVGHLARQAFGGMVWNTVVAHEHNLPREIMLDTASWMSQSHDKGITIGTKSMTPSEKKRLMFREERFSYTDEVTYRLLHEVAHRFNFHTQDSRGVQDLLALNKEQREQNGPKGLTVLGSLDYYRESHRFIEDSAELVAMYAWDPGYLAEYTNFLANPDYGRLHSTLNLQSLSAKAADEVFHVVEAAFWRRA